MLKKLSSLVRVRFLLLLSDIVLIPAVFILAYSLKFKIGLIFQSFFNLPVGKIYPHAQVEPYLHVLGVIIILWIIAFYYGGMYKIYTGLMPEIDMIFSVIKGVTLGVLELMIFSFLYKSFPGSRYVLLYAWGFGICFLILSRYFIYKMEYYLIKNDLARETMIIGAGEFGQDVAERMILYPNFGFNYVGTIADEKPKKIHFHLQNRLNILGTVAEFEKIIKTKKVKCVFCTETSLSKVKIEEIVDYCEKHNIEIRVLSPLANHLGVTFSVDIFDSIPFDVCWPIKVSNFFTIYKRVFDFLVSLLLLLLLSPIFLVAAVLIKIISWQGPVFYIQERVGKDNKLFGMIKFRTMIPNAEKETGPVMVDIKKETRYLPLIGNFFRKSSIDELPQLINVLKGEMSIIGPRPERPFFVDQFAKDIKYYNYRHKVKGGITGWAQINGRSVLTSRPEHKLKYDLYYIKHWSFLFDLKILLKTVLVVWKKEEAY